MRVLHLGKYFPPEPGGIEYVLENLLEGTKERFGNYAIVADKGSCHREEAAKGYTVFRRKQVGTVFLTPVLPGLFRFLHRLRKSHRFDCIVLHVPNPMTLLALYFTSRVFPLREKLVVYYHADILLESPLHRIAYACFRPFETRVLDQADLLIATSPNMARFSDVLRRYSRKVEIVPLMVPDSWSSTTREEEMEAERIRRVSGRHIVLFVGRLIPYKGLDTLVSAAGMVPGADFFIVGDGPLERELKMQARGLGLEDRFRFMGRVDNLKPYYLACDLLVLPSDSALEAFGLVQLEAMSFGKPVVSSNLPTGVTYVNRDGETGLTFPVKDADRLAEALRLLLSDDSLRSRLGSNARERVRKEFLSSRVGIRFERAVEKLFVRPHC